MPPLYSKRRKKVRSNGYYTPLLPYLAAMMAAFAFAAHILQSTDVNSAVLLYAGIGLILFQITINLFVPVKTVSDDNDEATISKKFFLWTRGRAFLLAGFFFICAWYFCARVGGNPYPNFAPCEMSLRLKIVEISKSADGSYYGVGEIAEAPSKYPKLDGAKIWYSFKNSQGLVMHKVLARSQTVEFSSLVMDVHANPLLSRGDMLDKPNGFEKYLLSRFIFYKAEANLSDVKIVGNADSFIAFFNSLNAYMRKSLTDYSFAVDVRWRDTLAAMLLGDKSMLTQSQKDAFIDSGTMHVFAISGLHVGFVAALCWLLCRLLCVNWRIQPLLVLPILLAYAEACGGRPSAMRAFEMIAVIWLAMAFGRGMRPFGALVISAFLALAISPVSMFDAGFVLSYSIVASIFLYGLPLAFFMQTLAFGKIDIERITFKEEVAHKLCGISIGGLCISFGAFIAASPLGAHYFDSIAPMSILYSPVFVLCASIAVGLAFAGFALPSFAAGFLNFCAAEIVGFISEIATSAARIFNMSVSSAIANGWLAADILFSFLGAAFILDNKNAALRFLIPPSISTALFLYFADFNL